MILPARTRRHRAKLDRLPGRRLVPACLLLALGVSPAIACQICVPLPTKSAADHLIEAEVVALAREDPDKPFSLEATKILKGELASPKIDLFLDSTTRRLLASNPGRQVLCVRRGGEPEAEWRRIGTTNEFIDPLVPEILAHAPEWKEDPEQRVRFFAPLLDHEDEFIRTLAHLETGNAPYSLIRSLGEVLPRSEILAFLGNYRMMEWHALYILLLAQNPVDADRDHIRERVRSAAQYGTTIQLAAWATALIEIDEGAGLDLIRERYLDSGAAGRKTEEWLALVLAFSVHGNNGHRHLRPGIVEIYGKILEVDPLVAPQVVGDLTAWECWDMAKPVAAIAASPPESLDLARIGQLRRYLRQAEAAGTPAAPVSDRSVNTEPASSSPGLLAAVVTTLIGLAVVMVLLTRGRARR